MLSVVDWAAVSRGESKARLYLYEDFLAEYDPNLRKQTGSYYTPVEVTDAMTNLVDEELRSRFGWPSGLANNNVTVLDPATGRGTFLLAV